MAFGELELSGDRQQLGGFVSFSYKGVMSFFHFLNITFYGFTCNLDDKLKKLV